MVGKLLCSSSRPFTGCQLRSWNTFQTASAAPRRPRSLSQPGTERLVPRASEEHLGHRGDGAPALPCGSHPVPPKPRTRKLSCLNHVEQLELPGPIQTSSILPRSTFSLFAKARAASDGLCQGPHTRVPPARHPAASPGSRGDPRGTLQWPRWAFPCSGPYPRFADKTSYSLRAFCTPCFVAF